jgi:hypothetical protein
VAGVIGATLPRLDPVLLDFADDRAAQKAKYFGEFFPAQALEVDSGRVFLDFFQIDKRTGHPKGILALDTGSVPMIKNERQYRITRAQAERFERELAKLADAPADAEGIDPVNRKAVEDAAPSQLATLRREKEQQIQRYEATDYASASLRRVREVVEALGEDVIDVRISVGPAGG